jgi:hypothetical protein
MPFWSRFFGSATPANPAPATAEEHKGFRITPAPIRDGGQFRVSARIEKDGRTHTLIRADTSGSEDEARAISVAKAKQMIDEQGEGLFG